MLAGSTFSWCPVFAGLWPDAVEHQSHVSRDAWFNTSFYTPCHKVRACLHKTSLVTKKRATNPITGGRPTQELSGNDPRTVGQRPKNRRPPYFFQPRRYPLALRELYFGTCPRSVHFGARHKRPSSLVVAFACSLLRSMFPVCPARVG